MGLPSALLFLLRLTSTLCMAQSRAKTREDRSFHSRLCAGGGAPRAGFADYRRDETILALARANLARLPRRRYSCAMRPLRYSINVTLDGCCDHRAITPDEDLHRHAVENLEQADALLFGRVTYEMMEAAWRPPAPAGARPDWMEPFARTIDAAKKYVVSSTLERVDWNAELVRGDLAEGRSAAQAGAGQGTVHGRREAPAGVGGAGIDR